MQKELYKIDIIKLTLTITTLTTVVVLGLAFSFRFFSCQKSTGLKNITNKVGGRLTEGIIDDKQEKTTPEKAVLKAVNANRSRVVKIYAKLNNNADLNEKNEKFLARGIILSEDGIIVTAKGAFQERKEYSIIIPGKKDIFNLQPLKVGERLAFFKIPTKFNLVVNLENSQPQKNDLVVAISGREKDGMAVGKILKIENIMDNTLITTTIPPKSIEAGTPLINQKEKVIGIYSATDEEGRSLFVTGKDIKKAKSKLKLN